MEVENSPVLDIAFLEARVDGLGRRTREGAGEALLLVM